MFAPFWLEKDQVRQNQQVFTTAAAGQNIPIDGKNLDSLTIVGYIAKYHNIKTTKLQSFFYTAKIIS